MTKCNQGKIILFFKKQMADGSKIVKNAHPKNQNTDKVQIYAQQNTGIAQKRC